MTTDLTFFTNEPHATLRDRFNATLKAVQYFDVLVGYFRTSGFYELAESLEDVDKIRILVGLNVDKKTYEIIDQSAQQTTLDFVSHKEARELTEHAIIGELDASNDDYDIEFGIKKFIEYLTTDCHDPEKDNAQGGNGKKLEFKAYPSSNIHAKVYISRYDSSQLSYGSVITGSSNFSASGLVGNREFNVELKNKNQRLILADPQTSGGLLVAVAPESTTDFLKLVKIVGLELAAIGTMQQGKSKKVYVK